MDARPFGLLELGSNSLKFYLVERPKGPNPSIETRKIPWRVAHDYFLTGTLSDSTINELIDSIHAIRPYAKGLPLPGMLAIATGVFREIDNVNMLADRVKAETGLRIRVITGEDEAKLMAKDFAAQTAGESIFLFDLGGATMEWAWFEASTAKQCGSVPLGAIRNEYAFRRLRKDHAAYLADSVAFCDGRLKSLPVVGSATVIGTGGTVKAAAKCAGSDTIPIETLCVLIDRVLTVGPPEELKPSRRIVFLPGLVILWRILKHCQAAHLTYGKASVRDGMAGRLVRLLGTHRRRDLHATLLLNTRQLRRRH